MKAILWYLFFKKFFYFIYPYVSNIQPSPSKLLFIKNLQYIKVLTLIDMLLIANFFNEFYKLSIDTTVYGHDAGYRYILPFIRS